MIHADVTVRGIEGFDDQFDEVFLAVDANLSEIASVVKASADSSTEFVDKTGYLRKRNRKSKSRFDGGGYIVFNTSPHAHLVEYGHVKFVNGLPTGERVPAHPFMRKSLEIGLSAAIAMAKMVTSK